MKSDRYDVVVVGAGIAGLTAAGAVAHRKMKVALVATGPGSIVNEPGWLKAHDILHASAAPDLSEAITFFCEMARRAGCPYAGDISTAKYLPSLLGNFESVVLAPFLLWNAEPRDGVATVIVGVRGLSSFDENFMAERLSERARATNSSGTYEARQISLARDMGTPVTTLRLAQLFDRDADFRKELACALRAAASGFQRIFVPGMLGLDSSAEQIAEFSYERGCQVCEVPTLPPSIPGLRVFHRLESYLRQIGVELFRGFPVDKVEIHDGVCAGVRIAAPGHVMNLRSQCVVLATGRHSAGLLHGTCAELDHEMRPIDSTGAVTARNVFVAGSLPNAGLSNNGDAMRILTGYRAGNLAASPRGNHAA
jgi:glycerol-3-phosphate dehydrogenase subunit B